MTPPPTIIGGILGSPWFRSPTRRRLTFAIAVLIFGILSLWPEHYVAETALMPQESGGGLSALLAEQSSGALLNIGALVGEKQSVEADLTIAKSHVVLRSAIARLRLVGRPGYGSLEAAEAKLERKLGIVAIRGSILQIRTEDRDPIFARTLVGAVAASIQDRLTDINLFQAALKSRVASNRLADATIQLANAQNALNQFRLAHRLPAPEEQLGSGVGILAGLEGQLQARQVELRSLQQMATSDNFQVKMVEAQIASLQQQIANTKNSTGGEGNPNLLSLASVNTQYYNLYRDEKAAETLFVVYKRYMDELTIDKMSADNNMEIIEPPYIEPARQFNAGPLGLLFLTLLLAATAEFYIARPPRGWRLSQVDEPAG